jgi:hypothetical protein
MAAAQARGAGGGPPGSSGNGAHELHPLGGLGGAVAALLVAKGAGLLLTCVWCYRLRAAFMRDATREA